MSFETIVQREQGLQHRLSAGQLSMIAIGGAIGTGLFLGSRYAISFAGPGVLLSYLIGAMIALLLMGCLAEMTSAHPTAGSFGAYAEFYVGPLAGFLVRYSYWVCIVLAVGTEVTAVAIYMRFWYATVPGWVWILLFSATLIGVNAVHVNVFGSVEYWFSLLKISAIVAFILLGLRVLLTARASSGIGLANYVSHGGFLPHGVWGVWSAVIIAIFSYLSIEMIAVAAGEAQFPQRAVISAFKTTVVRLVLFYLLTIGLMLAIVPWNAPNTAQSPFVKVMDETHIAGAAGVINFVILIAALSAMNSQLYTSTRMMFSLARAGHAPAVFGRVSGSGVPRVALVASSAGVGVAAVLSVTNPESAFTLMISLAIFGAMFTWLMIFVTHLFFRWRYSGPPPPFRMWGYPYGSLLGAVLMAAIMLTTSFTHDFRMTLVWGLPFLALLSLTYFVKYRLK